jgi:hypothetical protein
MFEQAEDCELQRPFNAFTNFVPYVTSMLYTTGIKVHHVVAN